MKASQVFERVLRIECAGRQLTGILAHPSNPRDVAVVVIVGGPQYRAGSHRQFVLLSRSLATAGYCALRFDVRGMGDSGGELLDFEEIRDDIDAAIASLLAAEPRVKQVVLWGLCDGASAALLHGEARSDSRVAALCLVNPWVRSEEGLARTQLKHYYLQRLMQGAFWRKLLSGQVAKRALSELWHSMMLASRSSSKAAASASKPYQVRMAEGLNRFAGPVLILLSSHDYTAKEFVDHAARSPGWQQALKRTNVEQQTMEGADHTCSNPDSQAQLERSTVQWLCSHFGAAVSA